MKVRVEVRFWWAEDWGAQKESREVGDVAGRVEAALGSGKG